MRAEDGHLDVSFPRTVHADRAVVPGMIEPRHGTIAMWCMYWTVSSARAWREGCKGGAEAPNRQAFLDQVRQGPPPGLLAYGDGDPVGWCRVMPREQLPGLARSRHFSTDLDINDVWSLACIVVRRSHRGRGMTAILTEARRRSRVTAADGPWRPTRGTTVTMQHQKLPSPDELSSVHTIGA